MYRHISKGGWTFMLADQGWVVSDCTGEGLKATLLLSQISPAVVGKKMEPECFYDAVNVLLPYQDTRSWRLCGSYDSTVLVLKEMLSPLAAFKLFDMPAVGWNFSG